MTDVDCQMELAAELGIAVANLRGLARSAAVRPDKKRAMASLHLASYDPVVSVLLREAQRWWSPIGTTASETTVRMADHSGRVAASAAVATWTRHERRNCFDGHGSLRSYNDHPHITEMEPCKRVCEQTVGCEGVVLGLPFNATMASTRHTPVKGLHKGKIVPVSTPQRKTHLPGCFLRGGIDITRCRRNAYYTVLVRGRGPG